MKGQSEVDSHNNIRFVNNTFHTVKLMLTGGRALKVIS